MKKFSSDTQAKILSLVNRTIPHGSGIDAKWDFEFKGDTLICRNSYHNMDENGYYDGWTDFVLKVNLSDFSLKVSRMRDDIGDYLWEFFDNWIQEIKRDLCGILGIRPFTLEENRFFHAKVGEIRKAWVDHFGAAGLQGSQWPEAVKEVSARLNSALSYMDRLTLFREVN